MGVLDDAIRQHLELKRKHGANEAELQRQEAEALGPVRREVAEPESEPEAALNDGAAAPEAEAPPDIEQPPLEEPPSEEPPLEEPPLEEPDPAEAVRNSEPEFAERAEPAEEEDVLEETPDFLQETPEHDRLWFEQKPPRDFDFD